MEFLGACKYCGQVTSGKREFSTQSDADEYATDNCGCDESQSERERAHQVTYAKERVRQLFGEDARRRGFEPVKNTEILEILNLIVEGIAEGEFDWATVKIHGGGKATLASTARGGIRVQRSITHACQLDE